MSKKKVSAIWRTVAIIAICLCLVVSALWIAGVSLKKNPSSQEPAADSDPMSLWTENAEAKTTLISYMEAITDEAGSDFIPVNHRIAVFDLDGTLFCETDPNYFDYTLLVHRVLEDPDNKDKATAFERETAYKILDQNLNGISFTGLEVDHGQCIASSFAGMTPDEFNAYIQEFKKLPMPSYDGMLRGEGWYKPMLQVVEYLQANDFTVYIVSGTDRFIVRGIVYDSPLDIPMGQIIGSDETLVSTNQGDTDGLQYVFDENDQLVAFGLSIPDLTEAYKKANGKLFPFGWYHILHDLKHFDTIDLLLNGVLPEWQKRGVHSIYYSDMNESAIKHGVHTAYTNPQIIGNEAVKIWETQYHTKPLMQRAVFGKEI